MIIFVISIFTLSVIIGCTFVIC